MKKLKILIKSSDIVSKYFVLYDRINHFLFIISIFLLLLNYLTLNISTYVPVIIFGLIILFRYLIIKSKLTLMILIISFSLLIFYLIKSLSYGSILPPLPFLMIFAQIGFALYLLKSKYNNFFITSFFYIMTLYFTIQIIRGVHPSELIIYSENIVNFLFIAFGVCVYFIRYIRAETLPLHPAIIILIVSLITLGRSGIISSILLLLTVVFFKYRIEIKYLLFILFIFLLFSQKFIDLVINSLHNISTRFGDRTSLFENVRFNIWESYIQNLDILKFLLGLNTRETIYFYGFTNPHNSFLSGHATLGVMLIFIVAIILYVMYGMIKSRNTFITVLLLILLIRSSADQVLFTGNFDFVYIFIVIYSFNSILHKPLQKSSSL